MILLTRQSKVFSKAYKCSTFSLMITLNPTSSLLIKKMIGQRSLQDTSQFNEYQKRIIALEVKTTKVGGLAGLNAFAKAFRPEKSLVIGTDGIPWEEFLQMNVLELYA